VIEAVPRAEFPWRTAAEALIYHVRVHGQTVARAADRIAQELDFRARDDLIGAALLHDVGKLVVARAIGEHDQLGADRTTTPEHRVAAERRRLKLDHAGLGALLLDRWGMPSRLSDAVGKHHTADADQEIATLVRLADAVAHHALGDLVDRRIMLHLAGACGLSVSALRDVLFDLPHSGSKRRRAEPSPLSQRETAALRHLAAGKVYKEIAAELGLSPSTIRSHLHSVYSKLEVEDRAQAVLRATEMGWI
jgi:putative nucleotidyltransferase with HDIG domain